MMHYKLRFQRSREEKKKAANFFKTQIFCNSTIEAMEGGNIPNVVKYWRANVFYRIVDSILGFLKTRFSIESHIITGAVNHFLKP